MFISALPADVRNAPALTWQNLFFSTNYIFGNVLEAHCGDGYKIKDGKSELRINCSSSGDWNLANNEDELVTGIAILEMCLEKDELKS